MSSYLPSWSSVTKAVSSIYNVARDINPATLTGAIDVVVVKRKDGTLQCSPFHVRFGKLKLLVPSEKAVEVIVNGVRTSLPMKVGDAGEAFFVVETEHPVPKEYATSPIPVPVGPNEPVEPLSLDGHAHVPDAVVALSPSSPGPMPSTAPTDPIVRPPPTPDTEPDTEEGESDGTPPMPNAVHPAVEHLFKSEDEPGSDGLLYPADAPSSPSRGSDAGLLSSPSSPDYLSPTKDPRDRYPLSDNETERYRQGSLPGTRGGMLSDTEHDSIVGSPPEKNWSWTWGALPTKSQTTTSEGLGAPSDNNDGTPRDLETPTSPLSPAPSSPNASTYARSLRSDSLVEHAPLMLPSSSSYEDDDYDGIPMLGNFKVDMSLCGQPDNLPKLSKEEAVILFRKNAVSFDDFCQNPGVLTDPNLVLRINDSYYSWAVAAPMIACRAIYGCDLPKDVLADLVAQHQKKTAVSGWRGWWSRSSTNPAPAAVPALPTNSTLPISVAAAATAIPPASPPQHPASAPPPSPPVIAKQVESPPPLSPPASIPSSPASVPTISGPKEVDEHNYAKTLRLTSDQLQSLNLQKGMNSVSFVVRSTLQGTATTNARIFLLDQDTKIVISDVDGTITKSDALGHLFTMVGRDWTHLGVAGLYTAIMQNGYQMLYLTSRAIGQASYTRDYLKKVEQGRFQLPDGPVIMSPDRLFKSFHREVILKKPEEFKMAVLRDIKRLFGDTNPFYAGFGNRITDALSYRSVGIPPSRIFTIDPAGDVKLELMPTYKSTYLSLNELAEYLFPPVNKVAGETEDEAYSDLNFWRQPLPDIDAMLDLGEEEDYYEEEEIDSSGVDLV